MIEITIIIAEVLFVSKHCLRVEFHSMRSFTFI